MSKKEEKKIKILVHADSPDVATGFGTVTRNIFRYLANTGKYDITIFGVNDRGGWKDPVKHPYKIYPTVSPASRGMDVYGRMRLLNIIRGADADIRPPFDIIFTLNDPFIYEERIPGIEQGTLRAISEIGRVYREKFSPDTWYKIISYWPVDSEVKENWVHEAVDVADVSVAYTNFGKEELEIFSGNEHEVDVIYHGTDTENFFPISEKEKAYFRKQFFQGKLDDEAFIVGIVARNQMRKDIPRAMRIFKEFQKKRPQSILYIHAKETDAWGSLKEYARQLGLEYGKDWMTPAAFNENIGFPIEALNKIYNVIDVHMSTSLGEGWGLPITEAMATKTVNIAPLHTSIPEIFGVGGLRNVDIEDANKLNEENELRGMPVKAGSTLSEFVTFGPEDYERFRPVVNVDDAVKKLVWLHDNPKERKAIAERAYTWVQQYSWNNVVKDWDNLIQETYHQLEEERQNAELKPKKTGTNKKTDKSKTFTGELSQREGSET